ncbi:MAG: zinc finger domain-containing protein [Gammaproteobacteria bacterium]
MGKRPLAPTLLWLVLISCLASWNTRAQADPANGFALYLGPVYSQIRCSTCQTVTSSGISLNGDAQMALNDRWTLNPYLELSSEHTNSSYTLFNGSAGLQARFWVNHWFAGGQFLFHSENRHQNGTITAGIYGPALGLVTGWEGDDHWSIVLEVNSFEGQGLDWSYNNTRTDARIQIGYRWY